MDLRRLGQGHHIERNESILAKWLWRLHYELDSLWQSIIRSKYGVQNNGWNSKMANRVSMLCPWKSINKKLEWSLMWTGGKWNLWSNFQQCRIDPRSIRAQLVTQTTEKQHQRIANSILNWAKHPIQSRIKPTTHRTKIETSVVSKEAGVSWWDQLVWSI